MTVGKNSVRVTLRGVTMMFGDVTAVDNIDLDIEPGSMTTLLGPSGCGKTTTLRLIAGLELPTSGRILIDGEDVSTRSASYRDVSMVFQSYALFPHMNVAENVGYGLKIQGVPEEEKQERVHETLASVGLEGYGRRYIDQLSGGQQQRVAVARALVLEPKVLLFDEPLSNLDTKLRRQMREDIRRLQKETGITSVYVTHDQSEALAVSDDVVVMNMGRIAQHGTPDDIYRRPNSTFVATFMGEANILDAELVDGADGPVLHLGGVRIHPEKGVPLPGFGSVKLAVRPESIGLAAIGSQEIEMKGTVEWRSYVGPATEYLVHREGQSIFVVVPVGAPAFTPGDEVALLIDPVGVAVLPE
jgi:iron(III) transport system ATP-binding protein